MRTIDVVAAALKQEGIEFLSCFPTTPVIEAAAQAGIRPIICRQERTGVGIADGYARVTNGRGVGAFAMQYGPGAENAYPGVATAFSDSMPVLLLPLGHAEDRQGVSPLFSAVHSFASVTKRVEQITSPERTTDVLRRALAALRQGRPGPVMVEIPADVAVQEVPEPRVAYTTIKRTVSGGDPEDVTVAARALCAAAYPVAIVGQGVLYAEATDELVALADLLGMPVMSTMLGKSAFPETHGLSLGCGTSAMPQALHHFVQRSDTVLAIGTSLTKHVMSMSVPAGKTLIHATNDALDVNKDYAADHAIVGDAKLVLRQLVEACSEIIGAGGRRERLARREGAAAEIAAIDAAWLSAWKARLTSVARPIDPYRVIWEFISQVDPHEAVVTHDSGNPRGQITPFYRAGGPRSYLGWGKSHGLGTGLGLIMGAKLAHPGKFCVNFMGDAAFGMVGLDFETAVRHTIPITTVVLNNSGMTSEANAMPHAEAAFRTSNLGGNYADVARALGGRAERVEDPERIAEAIRTARRLNDDGHPVLLEFVTARTTTSSSPGRGFRPSSGA